jgi:DNA-binding NtrC family response regulator
VSLLLVSEQVSDWISLAGILSRSNWNLRVRTTCREALTLLRKTPLPVVICDDESSRGQWHAMLDDLSKLAAPPALIVSSRLADERLWAKVLNLGGYDVLVTPFEKTEVLRVCYQAWQFQDRESSSIQRSAFSCHT